MTATLADRLRPRTRRAGFTLVELLFALTAISALSVLAMTVVAMLMTAEQHSAEGLWMDVTVADLADELRGDAHRAIELEASPDADDRLRQVTLVQPDGVRIVYECTADNVVRRRMQGDNVLATESYRLALGTSVFSLPDDDGLLTWTHTRGIPNIGGFSQQEVEGGGPQRTYRITAAVGLHRALTEEDEE